jgi:hypothetical protein
MSHYALEIGFSFCAGMRIHKKTKREQMTRKKEKNIKLKHSEIEMKQSIFFIFLETKFMG